VTPRAAALILALTAAPSAIAATDDCLMCHADASLAMTRAGREVPLFVDAALLGRSAHATLGCTDCHAGFKPDDLPHARRIQRVACLSCHDGVETEHPFHLMPTGGEARMIEGADCTSCHGRHDIAPVGAEDSPLGAARRVDFCGRCHREVTDRFRVSAHGRAHAAGAPGAPECLTCHRGAVTARQMPEDGAALKIAQEKACLSCHLENPEVRARMGPGARFIAAYEEGVHGSALLRGNGAAANCVDCHGSHEMEHAYVGSARVNRHNIPSTCGSCHTEIATSYAGSVHGAAVARGNTEAPVCTTCHGEHDILKTSDPRSPVAPANVSEQVCSPCHSSVRMERKYGIASDRFKTFSDSYHGLAIRGGDVEVANCASCHGTHDIRPSSDPRSAVNKANLAATCGRCHPGANERFAIGAVHIAAADPNEWVLVWIRNGYVVLIVVTIGGMAAHNILDFARRGRRRIRRRLGLEPEAREANGGGSYLRMTLSERLQHGALLVSFFVLVITGFMLHYPDASWVRTLRGLHDGFFAYRATAHRVAGLILLGAAFFHLCHLAFTRRGRDLLRDMVPVRRDLSDVVAMVRHNLGLTPHPPRFGRFGYVEKSEYWALAWGTIVMGVTGLILWFENTSMGLLTKLGWDISRGVHFWEAWLATLAILVWHLYYVIFNPDVYPTSTSWLTGSISE
jgi:cytochrome b subunit of formate dehydrogenase